MRLHRPERSKEETIDEEEADAVRYEQASDEGYEEFEEETRAAVQQGSNSRNEFSDIRATVGWNPYVFLSRSRRATCSGRRCGRERG